MPFASGNIASSEVFGRSETDRAARPSPSNIRQNRVALFGGDLEEGLVPLGPLVIDEDVFELGAERVRYQGVGLEDLQRVLPLGGPSDV